MSLRFRRSIKIAPGLRINLGKTGMSMSLGVRGATMTVGSRGVYGNVGLPGTGISYRAKLSGGAPRRRTSTPQSQTYARQKPTVAELEAQASSLNRDIDDVLDLHLQCKSPREQRLKPISSFTTPQPEVHSPKKTRLILGGIWLLVSLLICLLLNIMSGGLVFILAALWTVFAFKVCRSVIRNDATKQREWAGERDAIASHNTAATRWNALASDPARRSELLDAAFGEVDWPRETLFSFEFKDAETLALDIDLPEVEDMPHSFWTVRKSGASLEQKQRSETQVRKDYGRHVHAICMLAASVAFWAVPELTELRISGYTQRADKATGVVQDDYILSVRVPRTEWERIDFTHLERVDPIEALAGFDLRRDMTKTCIMKTIEPFA